MKIYLLDINLNVTLEWEKYFSSVEDVEIVNSDFASFMDTHPEIEAIVSPANSFGLMDGGYDKAITDYFGKGLMKNVQQSILLNWRGEQPVGTSISVPIYNRVLNTIYGSKICILIHTPTMRTPEVIKDPRIIYQCMRTTLIEAMRQGVKNIVIPAFGGATGKVPYDEIARMMFLAYDQVYNPPTELNWGYAYYVKNKLKNKD